MNSIIEAQQEFTECFGELNLERLCQEELLLPAFSREFTEYVEFAERFSQPGHLIHLWCYIVLFSDGVVAIKQEWKV